jgi:hypothetical protein
MRELLELSDEDRELAMSRFRVLQPHLEQDMPFRVVAAEAGLAFRTLFREMPLIVAASLTLYLLMVFGMKRVEKASFNRL